MIQSILYLILVIGLVAHGFIAYEITGLLPGYSGSFYWFTIPHLILIPTSIFLVVWDFKTITRYSLISSIVCIVVLLGTWLFAISMWPGGDDGPGMAWMYGVGLASIVGVLVGIPLILFAHKLAHKKQ